MKAKERHRRKLLEYLANPDNEFPTRTQMASICGLKRNTLYIHFSPEDFADLEAEALELRRKKYSSLLARADSALMKEAEKGNIAAIKLAYQRFDGFTEKMQHDVNPKGKGTLLMRWAKNKKEADG